MSARPDGDGWVRALAPAKLNVFLEITGRRADGFHTLDTWMLALALCDGVRVRLLKEPGIALAVRGPQASADIPADERNLVWRAARAVLDALGDARGVEIELDKHIPSESGLGGASSDAAATVLALERACGRSLEDGARRALLRTLGSDCAFFVDAAATGWARLGGRGDELVTCPQLGQSWHVALFVPAARCPTAEVYRAARIPLSGPARPHTLPPAWFDAPVASVRQLCFNRLEAAATLIAPELARWRALFDELDAGHVRMTGSGSAFFALCDTRTEAEELHARCTAEARRRGLGLRGNWVIAPAAHGAKLTDC